MSLIVGAHPPIVTPYCGICRMPAKRFQMDVVSSPYYVGIHASCCDRTSSMRVSIDEVRRLRMTNDKLWVVMAKGRMQGIRPFPRLALSYERG